MTRTLLIAALAALAVPAASPAMIMRHDVDEARYRDLGETYRPYLVQVAIPTKAGAPRLYNGMGALIAPGWVITAAHVAEALVPGRPGSVDLERHHVFVMGRGYRVKAAHLHPGYRGDGPHDIALLELETPVAEAQTACLYRASDEVGKIVTMASMGLPGDGVKGVGKPDGVLRGATVRVDGVIAEGEAAGLRWDFKAPGHEHVTPLEGISGPGDSGGPAFIEVDGRPCVAGVSGGQDTKGGPEGRYGVTEYYTRVSHYVGWIEQIMGAAAAG